MLRTAIPQDEMSDNDMVDILQDAIRGKKKAQFLMTGILFSGILDFVSQKFVLSSMFQGISETLQQNQETKKVG